MSATCHDESAARNSLRAALEVNYLRRHRLSCSPQSPPRQAIVAQSDFLAGSGTNRLDIAI